MIGSCMSLVHLYLLNIIITIFYLTVYFYWAFRNYQEINTILGVIKSNQHSLPEVVNSTECFYSAER